MHRQTQPQVLKPVYSAWKRFSLSDPAQKTACPRLSMTMEYLHVPKHDPMSFPIEQILCTQWCLLQMFNASMWSEWSFSWSPAFFIGYLWPYIIWIAMRNWVAMRKFCSSQLMEQRWSAHDLVMFPSPWYIVVIKCSNHPPNSTTQVW